MNRIKLFFSLFVILLFAAQIFSQTAFEGNVVETIDGRTLLVETARGEKVKVRLQYIEVPEPEQPLSATVFEHLKKMTLGKTVQVYPSGFSDLFIVGKVVTDGIDLSQQLLRDGAAWFVISAESHNKTPLYQDYAQVETAAKTEKRGVWGIAGMKTAWEFREEKILAEKRKAEEESEKIDQARLAELEAKRAEKQRIVEKRRKKRQQSLESSDLIAGFNMANGTNFLSSPTITFDATDGKITREIMMSVGYDDASGLMRNGGGEFGIAVGAITDGKEFLRENEVAVFTSNGKKIELGKPDFRSNEKGGKFNEILFYKIERETLAKIAADKEPSVRIGKYQRVLDRSVLDIINRLLQTTQESRIDKN